LIELHNAPSKYTHLIGTVLTLGWATDPEVQNWVHAVTHDVQFTRWTYLSQLQGNLHPERLNGWQRVGPLESLAGARKDDEVVVLLRDPVLAQGWDGKLSLLIRSEPVQITGRMMGLVKILRPEFLDPSSGLQIPGERFWVQHYNQVSGLFDGPQELIRIPQTQPDRAGIYRFTPVEIERSPLNEQGWYIYGEQDFNGLFVLQAIEPRAVMRVKPDEVRLGPRSARRYLYRDNWQNTVAQKGTAKTVLVCAKPEVVEEWAGWQEGDAAIVVHLYGGIGGSNGEPMPFGLVPGHFSYGIARVIRDPLTETLRFDVEYKQVYGHNPDGIIAGSIKWASYAGDLQRGWLGNRPISDVLIKLDAVTQNYEFDGLLLSPLAQFSQQLDAIAARYRIGHGTGLALINLATSCVQDSNQALYLTIKKLQAYVRSNPEIRHWLKRHPNHAQWERFRQLLSLWRLLERTLLPFGIARPDWRKNLMQIFKTRNFHNRIGMFLRGLLTWRTMMPRPAHDAILRVYLRQGAILWFIRTNQVGGTDSTIQPEAPKGLWKHRSH
jgi:predicted Abi (CAAX) family protease